MINDKSRFYFSSRVTTIIKMRKTFNSKLFFYLNFSNVVVYTMHKTLITFFKQKFLYMFMMKFNNSNQSKYYKLKWPRDAMPLPLILFLKNNKSFIFPPFLIWLYWKRCCWFWWKTQLSNVCSCRYVSQKKYVIMCKQDGDSSRGNSWNDFNKNNILLMNIFFNISAIVCNTY